MKLFSLCYSNFEWSHPLPDWDSEHTLVLVFAAPEFRDTRAPLEQLRKAYASSHLVGCSTAGEIHQGALMDSSLSVAIIQFESTQVRVSTATIDDGTCSEKVGRQLGEALDADRLRGVLVFSDGLAINGSDLTDGLSASLGADVIVTGGLAGDGDRFGSTWVWDGDNIRDHVVTAVGLYSEHVHIGHGSKGGWDLFGPERRVTRSEENVLYELDGQPALELYKKYLGDRADGLPGTALLFPLALHKPEQEGDVMVRTILSVDESKQSMTFAGNVPQGQIVQLMRANFDRLIDGASEASSMSFPESIDGDVLSIAISCVGRRMILGGRAEEELEAALEALPRQALQVGFYSYGELSPLASGECALHNQTMTLTTLWESAVS